MQHENRSWRNIIYSISAIILIFLLLSVMNLVTYYQAELRNTYLLENTRALQTWSNTLDSVLDTIHSYNYEVALALYNNTELKQGTPPMRFEAKKKITDTVNDKVTANEKIDFMFVLNTDDSSMIFSAGNAKTISTNSVFRAKEKALSMDYPLIAVHDTKWSITTIDGIPCFLQTIKVGKYSVGTMSRLTNFDASESIHVLGQKYVCAISSNDEIYYIAGDEALISEGELSIDLKGNNNNLQVITEDFPIANATLVLAFEQDDNQFFYTSTFIWVVISSALTIAMLVTLLAALSKLVSRPVDEMLVATQEVASGNFDYQMPENWDSTEFRTLTSSFNKMTRQIRELKIEAYDAEIEKRSDELTMLRAQIQPHFFLNAITTVNNMTYQDRNADIRKYVQALAKFMRYMLNLRSKMIPLGDEITHIGNYLQMQSYKFPNSVHVEVECNDDVKMIKIPYLLVFTVVENAFKHAMDLYHPLELKIQCQMVGTQKKCCLIRVSDNGKGFSQEVLEMFHPGAIPHDAKEHLGLTNISRTLNLVYEKDNLLKLMNLPNGGACVEILIPVDYDHSKVEDEHETVDL